MMNLYQQWVLTWQYQSSAKVSLYHDIIAFWHLIIPGEMLVFQNHVALRPTAQGVSSLFHVWCSGQTKSLMMLGKLWAIRDLCIYSFFCLHEFLFKKYCFSTSDMHWYVFSMHSEKVFFFATHPNVDFWKPIKESEIFKKRKNLGHCKCLLDADCTAIEMYGFWFFMGGDWEIRTNLYPRLISYRLISPKGADI